ncbi:GNAT family N-acetyltransferase [Stackebrandtia nassauensis]|uniref:GCN5-related N-acetyltransferase n=1 Tax=Stackebrandtia nassauensis (strain DSM 44728 / CIP 108903 / NRRL B-16338 / NBRC 102104 / LLR-40K-21) TaxID=446470 RepID=D3PVC0_STANL|nr:GNAT family N-acetyltransferase [Stackebrandtia nassauensis]ADD41173.1 GCN5-related N-acetyltransferase [Stackebrandtia nassauensis DSM 44728]
MRTEQRYGTKAEKKRIIAAQREAFADEAVVRWVTSDPARREKLDATYVEYMVTDALKHDEVLLAVTDEGRIVGVSIWQTFDSAKRPAELAAEVAALSASVPGLDRVATVTRLIAEHHPDKPHLYLSSMGVVPDHRGKGVGSALLRHRLAAADAAGQAAYLEASTPSSRDLYARHGFVQREPDIALPDDGPRLHPMWREPGTGD